MVEMLYLASQYNICIAYGMSASLRLSVCVFAGCINRALNTATFDVYNVRKWHFNPWMGSVRSVATILGLPGRTIYQNTCHTLPIHGIHLFIHKMREQFH